MNDQNQKSQADDLHSSGNGNEIDKDAQMMAMLAHLLGIFTSFVGPLIIYLIKKDDSEFVEDQSKEALNFQITMLIAHMASGILWTVCIGVFLTMAVGLVSLVLGIMATLAANGGERYRYPLCLRLIK